MVVNGRVSAYSKRISGNIGNNGTVNGDIQKAENIYVKEEYRGRGIGTELVNYVIFLAKKRRVKRVEFCAWHFDKKTAKFIEKFSSRVLTKIFEIDSF